MQSTNTGLEYDCALTGNVYYCPPVTFRVVDLSPLNATLSMQISSNGTFQNRGQQTLDQVRFTVSCVGDDCEQVGSGHPSFGGDDGASFGQFPCTSFGDSSMVGIPEEVFSGEYLMRGFTWDDDGCNAANNMLGIPGFPDTMFSETEVWQDRGHHGARIHVVSQNTGLSYYCNITGDYQQCAPIVFNIIGPDVLGVDATLRLTISSSGHYEERSRTKFNFDDITFSVLCEGAACEAVAAQFGGSFPCASVGTTTLIADPIAIYEGNYWMDAFTWNEDDGCDAANSLGIPGFPNTEFIFHEIYDVGHHGAQFRVTSTNTGLTYLCNLTGDEYYCPPVSTSFGSRPPLRRPCACLTSAMLAPIVPTIPE